MTKMMEYLSIERKKERKRLDILDCIPPSSPSSSSSSSSSCGHGKEKVKEITTKKAGVQPASQPGRHHQLLSLQRNQIREQEQEERREPHERLCSLSLDCIRPNIIIGLTFVKMRRRGDDDVEMRWDWNGSERNRDGIEQAVLCSLPPTWQLSYRLSERDTEQNQYLIEFELICL